MAVAQENSGRRRNWPEWLLLSFVLSVVGLFLAYAHLSAIDRALATERDRLRVQAEVIAVDMERNLSATNLALDGVIRDHWTGGAASTTPEGASRRLLALVEAVPGVTFMGMYDANGNVIASSRADVMGRDFSHRDYFVSVRDRPDAATLYVAAPFKSIDNRLVTTVSRMLPGPDGKFAGVIVATLDPAYFASVLRPLGYAPDVRAVVMHGDGRQLASFPAVGARDGVDLNQPGTFFRRHTESGQSATVMSGFMSSADPERLMALRTVQPLRLHMNKAMLVGVSREIDAIKLPLQREAGVYGGLYGVLVILSGGLLYWSQRRRAQIDDLTDERERVREEAAERVQLALRGASLGLWDIDLANGGWSIDESCAAFIGYTVQEIGATPARWRALMHPQDREPSALAFAACINGDAPFYEFNYRLQHRDGHWVWMQARGQVIARNQEGKALRIMGTVMDITLARKADAEVWQARNELQAVFDNMTEALLVYDNQRNLLRVNQASRTMHNLFDEPMPLDKLLPFVDLLLPGGELLPPDRWPCQRAFRGDFVRNYEVQLRRKDNGRSVHVEYNTASVRDGAGQVELVIIAYHDVTERRASLALRQSEARFRTLIEDAPLAVAILRGGHIVYSNPRYHTLHGYTNDEDLTGLAWNTLMMPTSRAALEAQQALIAADSPIEQSFEAVGLGKAGAQVQVHNTTARVELADGAATLIFAQDISAQKQAEAALMQARDVAESANRSKAEFLANMSHEIRSPMNVILGLAYLLEKVPLGHDAHDMVQKIRSAGRRLLRLINDILDVSKIEAGRMELEHAPFRLGDVIDNVVSIMGMAAGDKNIELVVEQKLVDCGGGSFMGDALRLEQVLINLVSNAIKFTSTGQVVLRVEALGQQDDRILMRFSVKDTGIGIALELQREVFSAFSQADSSTTRKFGGTGLGLTICRQLVTLMGGEIGLESTLGEGSDFWFKVELQPIPESDFSSPEMAQINTLVADDSSIGRDAVVAAARGLGWNVEAFDSGEATVAHLLERNDGRLPDVVVLDWKMPGMDGLGAARAIREAVPVAECPIVIMATAYSLSALSQEPGAEMVDAILSKPVTLSALYNSVLEARRRRAASVDRSRAPEDTETRELLGLQLLVVDDSEINCEVAKRILEEQGAQVQLAFDGSAALDWLLAHPTDVDLVLLDVQMPIMDGLEVTRRLRLLPEFKALPIIALTAGAFKSQRDAAREAGMTDFVGKPFDVPSTVALIRRLTRQRPAGAAHTARAAQPEAIALRSAAKVPDERLVMDVSQGLSTWGKLDTYRDYLRRFVAAYGNAAVVIATSLSTGDHAGACALAHKLTGVAANMALPEAYRLAADVERLLTDERDATVTLAQLDSALQEACASIDRFASAPGVLPDSARLVAVLDPEAQLQVEALLAQLLEALDTDSPVPVEPIMSRLDQFLPAHFLDEIRGDLRGFDFRVADGHVVALAHELGVTIGDKTS
jgi:PAS domain S-box-containing protein